MKLEEELRSVLNRHCAENESNTPDFILAHYLTGCLLAFNEAVARRENWYGRDDPWSTSSTVKAVGAED